MSMVTLILAAALAGQSTAPARASPPKAAPTHPAPPALHFVFEERVDLEPAETTGEGPRGIGNRIGLRGGQVSGPALNGTIVPGGADWQLVRKDGCAEIVADYFIRADDQTLIHVRNIGLACEANTARPPYARANPVFTAPIGRHDWLNKSVFTSTIEPVVDQSGAVRQVVLRFYEVR